MQFKMFFGCFLKKLLNIDFTETLKKKNITVVDQNT